MMPVGAPDPAPKQIERWERWARDPLTSEYDLRKALWESIDALRVALTRETEREEVIDGLVKRAEGAEVMAVAAEARAEKYEEALREIADAYGKRGYAWVANKARAVLGLGSTEEKK